MALSPQPPQYGRSVRRRAKLEFDVLTDLHLHVAEAFGLAFTLPSPRKEVYAAFGHALDKFHNEPDSRGQGRQLEQRQSGPRTRRERDRGNAAGACSTA